jgi:hypothetical protein
MSCAFSDGLAFSVKPKKKGNHTQAADARKDEGRGPAWEVDRTPYDASAVSLLIVVSCFEAGV